jgi:hypothetical protein
MHETNIEKHANFNIDRHEENVFFGSLTEALAAPVLGFAKKILDGLLVPVPQAAINAAGHRWADAMVRRDRGTARKFLQNASLFTPEAEDYKEAVAFLGFSPVPDKIFIGIEAAFTRLSEHLQIEASE